MKDPTDFRTAADAIRHAVARRVAAAVRHDVVGKLHPLMLLADVLERQLSAAAPDIVGLRRSAGLLQNQLKKEAPQLVRMANWSFPREGAVVSLGQCVTECLSLLAADFGIHGFRFDNRIGDAEVPVAEGPLRSMLLACLLAAADNLGAPADLVLQLAQSADGIALSIEWHAQNRTAHTASGRYEPLPWADVELLVAAEEAAMVRSEMGIVLRLARRRG